MLNDDDRKQLIAKPDVPRGLEFHVESALTQARMALKETTNLHQDCLIGGNCSECETALVKQKAHLASVIEHLGEIAAKVKAAKEGV